MVGGCWVALSGCVDVLTAGAPVREDESPRSAAPVAAPWVAAAEPEPAAPLWLAQRPAPLPSEPTVDCQTTVVRGYQRGKPVRLRLVTIGNDQVEIGTAEAYWAMRQAAAADGVDLRIRSAFRTADQQAWLYRCYKTCSCNQCTKAARPGYSRHQNGRALDLATRDPEVYPWLQRNAGRFGFRETVRGEPWHWEYQGRRKAPGELCPG